MEKLLTIGDICVTIMYQMRHFLKGGGNMTVTKDYDRASAIATLRSTKLFAGVDDAILTSALETESFCAVVYEQGEIICSPSDAERKMVVFLSGKAEIYSADEGRSLLLRTVGEGCSVGVANLFSNEDFVSRVIAAKKCSVLEISAENYGKILEKDSRAMYNFVAFLSQKIRYLNKKIVCLTAGSAERRLAYFLDSSLPEPCDCDDSSAEITVQMNSLCEMLNLGRASLYRAADKLCEEGFIRREGKKIIVTDRKGMMQKYV